MPTVLRLNGLRVVIYANDHRPEHVHVIGRGGEAVFELGASRLRLRDVWGFSAQDVRQIEADLRPYLGDLIESWRTIHGDH